MFNSILPPQATPFECHLEEVGAFEKLSVDELATLSNPWQIDQAYLPWLAHRFAIEMWHDDWSEEKKRAIIARAIELQKIKGTQKGLREYIKLADGALKQLVVAPQHFWAAEGLSKQQINSWHNTMPQIRVYFTNERWPAKGFSFAGDFSYQLIAMPNIARSLYGRQARLWDNGVETPLNLIEFEEESLTGEAITAERVSIPGKAGRTFYSGGFADASLCEAVIKAPEIVTWNKNITYSYQSMSISTTSLTQGLKPVDQRCERVSDHWNDGYSFASSRFANQCFAAPNKAHEKLYDRLIFHDPHRASPKVSGLSFTNFSMLGMPAFNARILVDLKEKRQAKTFFADFSTVNTDVAAPDRPEKRLSVDRAVTLSKSSRDRIYASYQTSRPITFGDSISFDGSIRFNTRVENRL